MNMFGKIFLIHKNALDLVSFIKMVGVCFLVGMKSLTEKYSCKTHQPVNCYQHCGVARLFLVFSSQHRASADKVLGRLGRLIRAEERSVRIRHTVRAGAMLPDITTHPRLIFAISDYRPILCPEKETYVRR